MLLGSWLAVWKTNLLTELYQYLLIGLSTSTHQLWIVFNTEANISLLCSRLSILVPSHSEYTPSEVPR